MFADVFIPFLPMTCPLCYCEPEYNREQESELDAFLKFFFSDYLTILVAVLSLITTQSILPCFAFFIIWRALKCLYIINGTLIDQKENGDNT